MQNVTKNFGSVKALADATLCVKKGEIMALLGSNGSGKSTLMKILSGLVGKTSGEIYFEDKKVEINSAGDSLKLGVAVAYQDLSLIQSLTIAENLCLNFEPKSKSGLIDKEQANAFTKKYLDMLKIDASPETVVSELMPSTQSMVEIAKAISKNPKVLVLDEATAALHSDEVDTLFELLVSLKAEGMSIIIVTHRMGEIFRICDRCTVLKAGESVMEEDIDKVSLDEIVFHMTGKRPDKNAEKVFAEEEAKGEIVLDAKGLVIGSKLRGVDVQARAGEIIGISGLDGQGQSEFIRAVLADAKYSGGQIEYKGKVVNFKTPADAIADDIGFISGDRAKESVFSIRSVAENIFAAKSSKGGWFGYLSTKEISEFSQDAIDEYGVVAGGLNHPASSLSGGNQQKLVVARWLALKPKLLLLDDPTKGVDIHSRHDIHAILKKCVGEGMSVIYVSSDNEEVLEISDRIYVFYEGKITAELTGGNKTEEKLVAAMLGINENGGSNE